ncbi:MAG: hypothetical protein Q4D38_13720, partial [Planctomycetia bacterium]|nr:hypothetical protein [Planctomycetia bacterium]
GWRYSGWRSCRWLVCSGYCIFNEKFGESLGRFASFAAWVPLPENFPAASPWKKRAGVVQWSTMGCVVLHYASAPVSIVGSKMREN